MRVTITMEPRPMTRPGFTTTRTWECEYVTRNEKGMSEQLWLVLHNCKSVHGISVGDYRVAEEVIRDVKLEEF